MQPVRHDYRYQLGYAGKQKVGMKCFRILCLAASETETVFDVVNGALNGCADFISGFPLLCSSDYSGTKTKVLFRIDVNHASATGFCARIVAMTNAAIFPVLTFVPAHFGTDKLVGFNACMELISITFGLHWEGRIIWTAGNAIRVDSVFGIGKSGTVVQRKILGLPSAVFPKESPVSNAL